MGREETNRLPLPPNRQTFLSLAVGHRNGSHERYENACSIKLEDARQKHIMTIRMVHARAICVSEVSGLGVIRSAGLACKCGLHVQLDGPKTTKYNHFGFFLKRNKKI
jgi:hypothetical protein